MSAFAPKATQLPRCSGMAVFDVLAYIAFALPPITRLDRVQERRVTIMSNYYSKLQAFLDFVLTQYVQQGMNELNQEKLGALLEVKYHTIDDATSALGRVEIIRDAFVGFQRHLYERSTKAAAGEF